MLNNEEQETTMSRRYQRHQRQEATKKTKTGLIVLCILASIALPYGFIILMGLLDQMQIYTMPVNMILIIAGVLAISMLALAVYLKQARKK